MTRKPTEAGKFPRLIDIATEPDVVRRAEMLSARLTHIRDLARRYPTPSNIASIPQINALHARMCASAARVVKAETRESLLTLVPNASNKGI